MSQSILLGRAVFYLLVNLIFQVLVAGDERLTIPVVAIFIVVQLFLSIMVILIRKQKVSTIVLHASALILFSIFYFLATFKNGVVPGM